MDDGSRSPSSCLFTLRLWRAEVRNGRAEWRGKLQHVLSGESRYFKGLPALASCLGAMLSEQRPKQPGPDDEPRKEDDMT